MPFPPAQRGDLVELTCLCRGTVTARLFPLHFITRVRIQSKAAGCWHPTHRPGHETVVASAIKRVLDS
jgi:hypothetical protein